MACARDVARSAAGAYPIIGTFALMICGVLVGEVISMPRSSTDRHHRFDEINLVAQALAEHRGCHTEPVFDVDRWLTVNRNRRAGVVLVVWDRTDAAILERERDDVTVCVAASRIGWARRRARGAAQRGDIPDQERHQPE